MTPKRILIDLNVVLDVLQARVPHQTMSAAVLSAAERGTVEGWIAAHSITTLHYLYTKTRSSDAARSAITTLLTFLHVAPVDEQVIKRALTLPYQDFEDAVQMAAALTVRASCIVTRNVKDFHPGPLPAYTPADCLPLLDFPAQ